MESNFTPGPWRTAPVAINSIDIFNEEEEFIAAIPANNEEDLLTELEWANARLIAAAPDLLEALEHILPNIKALVIERFGKSFLETYNPVIEAEEAIAKAYGKETEG